MTTVSEAVLAAQAELNRRRTALAQGVSGVRPVLSGVEGCQVSGCDVATVANALSHLPNHLGWGSLSAGQLAHSSTSHQLNSTPHHSITPSPHHPFTPSPNHSHTHTPKHPHTHTPKHHPTLGLHAIKQQRVPHYQVWLACRLLDGNGRGWLELTTLREQLTAPDAALRLFGWRRLRQVLHQGDGAFWQYDPHNNRLWLYSAARIGRTLDCAKLSGHPVLLPLNALTQGIGHFKAHLYAAWHSGRDTTHPVSRQTLEQITHVPERTQRDYEQRTRTKVTPNLAVGAPYTPENIEEQAWQRGGAMFKFVDKNGRFGPPQTTYLAWQLPNSYRGPHQHAARGRQRRINHQLTDLVHQGAQGNGQFKIEKRYFDHGKDAAKNLKDDKTVYWPEGRARVYGLWHVISS